jgi:hypothetical protein
MLNSFALDAPTASEFVMFRRVTNIMAMGAAAGELGTSLQVQLGPDRPCVSAALDFRDNVTFQIVVGEKGVITPQDVAKRSPQQWDAIHSMFLTHAETVYFEIEAMTMAEESATREAMAVFKQAIDEGRRLELGLV